MGLDAMILVFWMLSLKPAFSHSSFTFIRGSLVAFCFLPLGRCYMHIWGYWLYLLAILILACTSSSPAFHMMYSACKLNEQGDNIQPSFAFNYLLIYSMISPLICWLFKSMLFNFHTFVISFFVFFLSLISSLIPLWPEKILCTISIFQNILRFVLWPNLWPIWRMLYVHLVRVCILMLLNAFYMFIRSN